MHLFVFLHRRYILFVYFYFRNFSQKQKKKRRKEIYLSSKIKLPIQNLGRPFGKNDYPRDELTTETVVGLEHRKRSR